MRRLVAACSVALAATAALGACSSGGGGRTTPTTSGTTPPNTNLSELVANANRQRFKITFTEAGSTQTYEQDGNGDSVYGSPGSLTFVTRTSTILCDKSSGSYECLASPGAPDAADNPFLGVLSAYQSQVRILGGNFGDTSTRTIAGRAAQCVSFTAGAAATYCLDKGTGVILEVSSTISGKETTSFLVSKFEAPRAADFTPPATPRTVTTPSLPG